MKRFAFYLKKSIFEKITILKCIFFSLTLFCSSLNASPTTNFCEARSKIIHQVMRKFKQAMQAKDFHIGGVGEGINHSNHKQNSLEVIFDIDYLPDVDFARHLEIETIQTFLDCINSEEGIQDYLDEYPFPLKYIRISFVSRHPENGLSAVWNFQDEIIYNQHDPDKEIAPSVEVHRESYDEAVCIISED